MLEHYIETIYLHNNKIIHYERRADRHNKCMITDSKFIQQFRYFDKNEDNEKINYSPWVYFGKRLSFDEINDLLKNNSENSTYLEIIRNNHLCAVLTQGGLIRTLDSGDKTYEEYCIDFKKHYEMMRSLAKEKLPSKDYYNEYTDKISTLSKF